MGVYYWSLMMYVRNQFMGVTLLFACIQVKQVAAENIISIDLYSSPFSWKDIYHSMLDSFCILCEYNLKLFLALDSWFPCLPPCLRAVGDHHWRVPQRCRQVHGCPQVNLRHKKHSSPFFAHPASSSLDLASSSLPQISHLVFLTMSMTKNRTHLEPPRRNSSSMQRRLRLLTLPRWWRFSSLPCLESRIMRMQKSPSLSCPGLHF